MRSISSVGLFYKLVVWLRKYNLQQVPFLRRFKRFAQRLLTKSDTFTIIVNGHKMRFWTREQWRAECLLSNSFEPYTTDLMKSIIKDGDTFLDVGAHLGYYTLLAAGLVGDDGRVIAFEAEPGNFDVLRQNVDANHYRNVTLVNKAASNSNGTCTLSVKPNHSGGHSLVLADRDSPEINIETTRIDDWLLTNGHAQIDVIKIDVEGAEPFVLEGLANSIRNSGKLNMFVEVKPSALQAAGYSVQTFLDLLSSYGFEQVLQIDEEKREMRPALDASALADSLEQSGNLLCIKSH